MTSAPRLIAVPSAAPSPRGKLPPVFRRLFASSSAVSLALFVIVCLLWARSYWAKESFSLWTNRFVLAFHNGGARMAVSLATGSFNPAAPAARSNGLHYDRDTPRPVAATLGADYHVYPINHPGDWIGTMRIAAAAHWFLAMVTSFLPVAWIDRHVRARRPGKRSAD
jgi:hypothetical protein